jgi:hypothetical protein
MRSAIKWALLLIVVAAVGVLVGRSVAPPAPPLTRAEAETDAGLDRRVASVNFDATPFDEAIESLRRQTGADITLKTGELTSAGLAPKMPVTLRAADLPLKRVLEMVCDDFGGNSSAMLDARAQDGRIIVSTRHDNARFAVTRMYDVRDLLRAHYETRYRFGWRPPERSTQPQTSGSGMLFGQSQQAPYDEAIETLTRLLMELVEPDMWRDNGGTVGNIRDFNGRLIIFASPAMHDEIVELLALLRKGTLP